MSLPQTRLAYTTEYEAFDKALADEKGIRIKVDDRPSAETLRSRLHFARQLDRRDNTQLYDEDDVMHGRSPYDILIVRIREDTEKCWWVYIKKASMEHLEVESLSEVENDTAKVPSYNIEPETKEKEESHLVSFERRI